MPLNVREATAEDAAAVAELFLQGAAYHAAQAPDVFRMPGGTAGLSEFVGSLIAEGHTLLLAEQGAHIVGVAHLAVREARAVDILQPRRYAVLETLVVRDDYRRHGIGADLVSAAEAWARRQGLQQIELTVWEFNTPALRLYEKLGYRPVHRRMSKNLD